MGALVPPARGLHAMTLTLLIRDGSLADGECRVDGRVSEALCQLLRHLSKRPR